MLDVLALFELAGDQNSQLSDCSLQRPDATKTGKVIERSDAISSMEVNALARRRESEGRGFKSNKGFLL